MYNAVKHTAQNVKQHMPWYTECWGHNPASECRQNTQEVHPAGASEEPHISWHCGRQSIFVCLQAHLWTAKHWRFSGILQPHAIVVLHARPTCSCPFAHARHLLMLAIACASGSCLAFAHACLRITYSSACILWLCQNHLACC